MGCRQNRAKDAKIVEENIGIFNSVYIKEMNYGYKNVLSMNQKLSGTVYTLPVNLFGACIWYIISLFLKQCKFKVINSKIRSKFALKLIIFFGCKTSSLFSTVSWQSSQICFDNFVAGCDICVGRCVFGSADFSAGQTSARGSNKYILYSYLRSAANLFLAEFELFLRHIVSTRKCYEIQRLSIVCRTTEFVFKHT